MNGHAVILAPDLRRARLREQRVSLSVLGAFVALAFVATVAFASYVDPAPSQPPPFWFVAGPAQGFHLGSVTYFREQHFYLVRLQDGTFKALYDLDARGQSFVSSAMNQRGESCRLAIVREPWVTVAHNDSQRGGFDLILREPCWSSRYAATGQRLFGPTPFDLDWFDVEVSAVGLVKVNVSDRHCPARSYLQRCY